MSDDPRKLMSVKLYPVDSEYELYLRAWIAYHEAADKIDGHLPPGHPEQAKIGPLAVKAGRAAMAEHVNPDILLDMIKRNDWAAYAKWINAKLDALKRLGL